MWLMAVLAGCLFSSNSVDDDLLLSDVTTVEALDLCEDFESRTTELECDGEALTVFPSVQAECRLALADVSSACGLTVGHLTDCVDALERAECGATLEDPLCEPLLDADCDLGAVLSEALGDLGTPTWKPIEELTAIEKQTVCEDATAGSETLYGDVDGVEVEISASTVADCVQAFDALGGCGLTLGDWLACAEVPPTCENIFDIAPECEPLFECVE